MSAYFVSHYLVSEKSIKKETIEITMNKIYQRISRQGVKYKLFHKIVPVKSDRNYQEIQFLKQLGCEYRKAIIMQIF